MMNRIVLYFEIEGLATDENGNPAPAGMTLDLGPVDKPIEYERLTAGVKIPELLKSFPILETIDPGRVRFITSEEYQKNYGDEKGGPS